MSEQLNLISTAACLEYTPVSFFFLRGTPHKHKAEDAVCCFVQMGEEEALGGSLVP